MSSNSIFFNSSIYQNEFIQAPGEHGVIYGTTGSGKTNLLIDIVFDLKKAGETIIYRDYGKEVETLSLAQKYPLKIFYPLHDDITLEAKNLPASFKDISYFQFSSAEDILNNLSSKEINVLSMRRYLRDPGTFNRFWSELLLLFIDHALAQKLPRPLTFALDEMHNITPGRGHSYSFDTNKTNKLSNQIAFSLQNLRATQTRILATSHGISSLYSDIRRAFQWYFFKRLNEAVDLDIKRLKMTASIIQRLENDQVVVVFPSKSYTDPISSIPYHLQLKDLSLKKQPYISYTGVFKYPEIEKKTTKNDIGALKKGIALDLSLQHHLTIKEIALTLGVTERQVANYLKTPD